MDAQREHPNSIKGLRILRRGLWGLLIGLLAGVVGVVAWSRLKTVPPDSFGTLDPFFGTLRAGPVELRLHLPTVVDLTAGENRMVFGFTDEKGRLLTDKDITDVSIVVYDLNGQKPRAVETIRQIQYLKTGWREVSKASYYQNPNILMDGFFKAIIRFPHAGPWGLEFVVHRPGRKPFSQRVRLHVLNEGLTPAVGAPAPRSRNLTLKDVRGDLSKLDSDPRLNDVEMHRVSIADAIKAGRPAVVIFSTPGFCESRMCLPNTEIVYSLYPEYGDRVEFIHVEIYQDFEKYQDQILKRELESEPSDLELRETVKEWGLQNDPYLFVIDRQGRIFAKFFGPIARSEVEETLESLTAGRSFRTSCLPSRRGRVVRFPGRGLMREGC